MGLGFTPAVQNTPLFPHLQLPSPTYSALAYGSKNNIDHIWCWDDPRILRFLPSVWAMNWHLHLNLLCNPLPWQSPDNNNCLGIVRVSKQYCFTMRNCSVLCLSLLAVVIHFVHCDVYLHSPRGSNNRLNEKSANRKNGNRVFDSQVRKEGTMFL